MLLIETTGLSKHYGQVKALDMLDLKVEPGIIGLVGANGAARDNRPQHAGGNAAQPRCSLTSAG